MNGDTAKAKIVELLRDDTETWTDKTTKLRDILDEFKGSYAARYFLEAILMMGGDNPTNLVLLRTGCNFRRSHQLLDAIELLTPPTIEQTLETLSEHLDRAGEHLQGAVQDLGQLVVETNKDGDGT